MTTTMTTELAAALVKAQTEARAVEKTAYNQHHKFNYASADAMIAEGRIALATAGLSLVTLGWKFEPGAIGDAPGRVVVRYMLTHTSGQALSWESSTFVVPGKGRPEDKAEFGAVTENLGYTLRGLLLLPRVEEGANVSGRDDRSYEPRQAPAAAPTPADPAVAALVAEYKRKIDDLPELEAFGALVSELDGVGFPKPQLDELHADLAIHGFKFATDREDLESWVPQIKAWKLDDSSRARLKQAYEDRDNALAQQRAA